MNRPFLEEYTPVDWAMMIAILMDRAGLSTFSIKSEDLEGREDSVLSMELRDRCLTFTRATKAEVVSSIEEHRAAGVNVAVYGDMDKPTKH